MSCIGDNIWLLTNAQELNELPLSQDWYLNHCKPMKRCPLKMNSLAFTFAACVLLCNEGRISIEINKLRGHIIHSNLTRLLSYFSISSLTNVSLMRPTEWTSHLFNSIQMKPSWRTFSFKNCPLLAKVFKLADFHSIINYQLSIYYNCTSTKSLIFINTASALIVTTV